MCLLLSELQLNFPNVSFALYHQKMYSMDFSEDYLLITWDLRERTSFIYLYISWKVQ